MKYPLPKNRRLDSFKMLLRIWPFFGLALLILIPQASASPSSDRNSKSLTIYSSNANHTTISVDGLLRLFDGTTFTVPSSLMSTETIITLFAGVSALTTVIAGILGVFLLPLQVADQALAATAIAMLIAYASDASGLSDAILERSSSSSSKYSFDYPNFEKDSYHETLLDDPFVSNHLTEDYDFKDNIDPQGYRYSFSSSASLGPLSSTYLNKILTTVHDVASDTISTVWDTTFTTARSLSESHLGSLFRSFSSSPFGRDLSKLLTKVGRRLLVSGDPRWVVTTT